MLFHNLTKTIFLYYWLFNMLQCKKTIKKLSFLFPSLFLFYGLLSASISMIMHMFSAFKNVWKEVENLPEAERIAVDYETLEKLFCRKLIAKAKDKPKVKPPKEVSGSSQA